MYLEKTVDSLKHKLQKDMEQHRSENVRIMQVRYKSLISISHLYPNPPRLSIFRFTDQI